MRSGPAAHPCCIGMDDWEGDDPAGDDFGEEPARCVAPPAAGRGFDPGAPEFVPSRASSSTAAPPKGRSLIFGGGGDFLSKYNKSLQDPGREALRRRAGPEGAPREPSYAEAEARAPERINYQLNRMLVAPRAVERVLQVVETHIEDFNTVNVITALHRLATLAGISRRALNRRDPRFRMLTNKLSETLTRSNLGSLTPQDLSNAAWALTKLGILHVRMFATLSEHIARTIGEFGPVNLSMTLWAFARGGFLDEKLFRAAVVEVHRQLPNFQPQQIANTAWAMAKSGFVDAEIFDSIANLTVQKLSDFQPMNYSMLVYSFAVAKTPHERLFEAVGRKCTVGALLSVRSAAPHVVTNLAYAYSEVGVVNAEVFDTMAEVAIETLRDFRSGQIATLARAFSKASLKHDKLFSSIGKEVAFRCSEFREQDLQELLASYDRLGLSTLEISRAVRARQAPDSFYSDAGFWFVFAVFVVVLFAMAGWRGAGGGPLALLGRRR